MNLLKWPRRLIVVCRGESATDSALRDAEKAGQSVITLPDRPSRAPLTPHGQDSARDAGKRLKAADHRPSRVFVGPDFASRQAAVLVLRALGFDPEADLPGGRTLAAQLPSGGLAKELEAAHRFLQGDVEILHDERLRDIDLGSFVGYTSLGKAQQIASIYRVDPGPLYRRSPNGESHADVTQRVRSFLGELGREFAGETLMLVTHRAVLHAIRRIQEAMNDEVAERELAFLEDGPPPDGVFEGTGPVARKVLFQSYNRMADLAQSGARNAWSRILRRGEEEAEPEFPQLPASAPADAQGRVLLTYLSAGNGHRIAAQAIENDIRERFPGIEIRPPEDLANFSRPGQLGAQLFYKVIDLGFYHYLYDMADRMPASAEQMNFLRQQMMQLASRKFIKLVKEFKPDIVINTHPLGTELLSGAQAAGKVPDEVLNYQVVTDCYGHKFYVLPSVHATFVPYGKVASELVEKGMPADRIFCSGIPIHPSFADRVDPKEARERLGLSPTSRVLLVQGNLIDDAEDYLAILGELDRAFPSGVRGLDVEVVVVCGKNAELHRHLKNLLSQFKNKVRLVPFGMVPSQQMRDIMRAADLSLTKPGGLTTAESIAMELPMVLLEVMGGKPFRGRPLGQEGWNAQYFQREGVAEAVYDFQDALSKVEELLDSPERLVAMRVAASRLARPKAASAISNVVVTALTDPARVLPDWDATGQAGIWDRRIRIPRLRTPQPRS